MKRTYSPSADRTLFVCLLHKLYASRISAPDAPPCPLNGQKMAPEYRKPGTQRSLASDYRIFRGSSPRMSVLKAIQQQPAFPFQSGWCSGLHPLWKRPCRRPEPGRVYRRRCRSRSGPVSYTHLTLPTMMATCRSRWSPYH